MVFFMDAISSLTGWFFSVLDMLVILCRENTIREEKVLVLRVEVSVDVEVLERVSTHGLY